MTAIAITLPIRRASAIYMPRRDLVAANTDSLALRITVVDSDTATAAPVDLSGGIGGPAVQLAIWDDTGGWWCSWGDYGRGLQPLGTILWSGLATIHDLVAGSFDIELAPGVLAEFPPRCAWAIGLATDAGGAMQQLAMGSLHIMAGYTLPVETGDALLTDDSEPVLEDDGDPVEV